MYYPVKPAFFQPLLQGFPKLYIQPEPNDWEFPEFLSTYYLSEAQNWLFSTQNS